MFCVPDVEKTFFFGGIQWKEMTSLFIITYSRSWDNVLIKVELPRAIGEG